MTREYIANVATPMALQSLSVVLAIFIGYKVLMNPSLKRPMSDMELYLSIAAVIAGVLVPMYMPDSVYLSGAIMLALIYFIHGILMKLFVC